jgi:hypothetical protein
MAVYSQNGYSANDRSVITTYTVTKTGRRMALRVGAPGEMLADFIQWFDENIRDLDPGILDEWGYAERPIRGGSELSNHASGTAGDVDATKWPLGVQASSYLTPAEIDRVHAKLAEYQGCIRWGGDYSGRRDPMHFEIDRDGPTVARVWAAIKAARAAGGKPADPARTTVLAMQKALHFVGAEVDGVWGAQTDQGVNTIRNAINGGFPFGIEEAQTRVGAAADGDWGPASRAALGATITALQRAWGATADGAWGSNTEARYQSNRRAYCKV